MKSKKPLNLDYTLTIKDVPVEKQFVIEQLLKSVLNLVMTNREIGSATFRGVNSK